MAQTHSINVTIRNNEKIIKELKEPVEFSGSSLSGYVEVLRSVQKAVNVALTEIVDQEKASEAAAGEVGGHDDDDDENEEELEDQKPNPTTKRKLSSHENNKKIKL